MKLVWKDCGAVFWRIPGVIAGSSGTTFGHIHLPFKLVHLYWEKGVGSVLVVRLGWRAFRYERGKHAGAALVPDRWRYLPIASTEGLF